MPVCAGNLFLASLAPADCKLLVDRCTAVPLPLNTNLFEAEILPRYAYFLTSGIASIVLPTAEGKTSQLGVIGREGVVGSAQLLGSGRDPTGCFMQIEGSALRMPFRELRQAFRCSEGIRNRLLEFIQEQSQNLSQIAGCHHLHTIRSRLAYWLLMVRDRTDEDVLVLTQEVLATMLGVSRPMVNVAGGSLVKQGLIEHARGQTRVLDRRKLELAACSCYQVTRQLYANLYKRDLPVCLEMREHRDHIRTRADLH